MYTHIHMYAHIHNYIHIHIYPQVEEWQTKATNAQKLAQQVALALQGQANRKSANIGQVINTHRGGGGEREREVLLAIKKSLKVGKYNAMSGREGGGGGRRGREGGGSERERERERSLLTIKMTEGR
jgi:hypothetical protein